MKLEKEVKSVFDILPPQITSIMVVTFSIPAYIQHIPEDVEKAQAKFMAICRRELDYDTYDDSKEKIHRQGITGRFLDDSGNSLLNSNWNRFMCIDEKYREWEQPYLSINYKKYEDGANCINDEVPEIKSFFRNRKIEQVLE